MKELCDIVIQVPSEIDPSLFNRGISVIGHILCSMVEETIHPKSRDSGLRIRPGVRDAVRNLRHPVLRCAWSGASAPILGELTRKTPKLLLPVNGAPNFSTTYY